MSEDIALTDIERNHLVILVASQINRVQNFREMRVQVEELNGILRKIQGVDKQLIARTLA